VEVLYGFLDFQKFKEGVLKYKQGGVDFTPEQLEQDSDDLSK
jgi:hypothetical protein